mmetsp:Transcript_1894/g.1966  ORF Transcript_1894/g.1966 Transcript_1894/m.1966 type:complete len:292 (-) Transcript_1894:262-1137(-)
MDSPNFVNISDLYVWGNAFHLSDEMIDYIQSLQINTTDELAEKYRNNPNLIETSFYHFEYCRPDEFPRLIEALDSLKNQTTEMTHTTTTATTTTMEEENEERDYEIVNVNCLSHDLLEWIEKGPTFSSIDLKTEFMSHSITSLEELIGIIRLGRSHYKYYVIEKIKLNLKAIPKKKFELYLSQTIQKKENNIPQPPLPLPAPPLLKSKTLPLPQPTTYKASPTTTPPITTPKRAPTDAGFLMRRSESVRGVERELIRSMSEDWDCSICYSRNKSFHEKCPLCLTKRPRKER